MERSQPAHVTVKYQNTGGFGAGLFNQHIAHEQAFMLAVALKVRRFQVCPFLMLHAKNKL